MAMAQVLEDAVLHPESHSDTEKELTKEVALYRLREPLRQAEAASILGVSSPTVASWARAGVLPAAPGSRPRRLLLDTAAVFAANKVLKAARLRGSPAQRVLRLRALQEEIYWATHPDELHALRDSMDEASREEFAEVDDDLVEAARVRRQSRPGAPRGGRA
ncbi:MAG TPA: helix-turn-helix domain-containing protein [Candidatus Dormibacteraeota bacterium]|jgi:hypothetical protein|nr:helix-turn-helix domain-containing protein [Candidatus Dormibacteraeota bacterium]